MTTSGDEMGSTLDARIASALRDGITSTAEARAQVMRAVRAATPPVRGLGDTADRDEAVMPLGRRRSLWRSPAFVLLAAASIAGVIALVRAIGVDGPIPDVPGQRANVARRGPGESRSSIVAPAASAGVPAVGEERDLTRKVQFVLVAPKARRVAVVGDFNDWDPAAAPLSASGGVWSGQVDVPYGRHDYAFVVDGGQWVRDPNAPQAPADEFGPGYSVLVVGDHLGEHR
ncbi:MAG: isoamylase early set domain-containing protein [Gemmatimonadaceae bacterium]